MRGRRIPANIGRANWVVDSLSQTLPNSQLYAQVTVSQATTFIRTPLITAILRGSPTEAVPLEFGLPKGGALRRPACIDVKVLSNNDLRLILAAVAQGGNGGFKQSRPTAVFVFGARRYRRVDEPVWRGTGCRNSQTVA